MVASEVCPAEDAIQLFLEYLVDPMLPVKSSIRDTPSESQRRSVAEQVHAVVLLYNYYHRKKHQQLNFEGFESFCKLVVVQRPALLAHMKLMQRSDDTDLNDLEKQLSLTEKTVMDACDISKKLDASKDFPSIEGWPISKIAIFLVDSRKENCFLQFSSITKGVWSLIEKDVNVSSGTEIIMEGKHKTKKIKVIKKPLRDGLGADELSFQQLAFSAVKEAVGFNQSDLTIMGNNVVYSLTKEKTAARFYVMQSTQPEKDDVIQIPIKDVIDSLQGPLVMKTSNQWQVSPVVEYFHLLPYARFLSEWFAREMVSNGLQEQRMMSEDLKLSSSKSTEEPYKPDVHSNQGRSDININTVEFLDSRSDTGRKSQQTDKSVCATNGFSGDCDGPHNMNVDSCSFVCAQKAEKRKNIDTRVDLDDHQGRSDINIDKVEFLGCSLDTGRKSQQTGKVECSTNDLFGDCDGLHSMNVDSCSLAHAQIGEKCNNIATRIHLDDHQGRSDIKIDKVEFPGSSSGTDTKSQQTDKIRCSMRGLSGVCDGPNSMNIDTCLLPCGQNGEKSKNIDTRVYLDDHQRMLNPCLKSDLTGTAGTKDEMVDSIRKPLIVESRDPDKLKAAAESDENILSQAALRILCHRRDKLTLQQRSLEDEIALCDRRIHTLLNGGKDGLVVKIETMLEGCDDICLRSCSKERSQHYENQSLPESIKMKRLSEAVLFKQNSSQELDDISYENNWMLPIYRVLPSDGGYQAFVTVKGMDFNCSSAGDLCPCPREARESAATQMLAKLRCMGSKCK